jgi:DNA helicase-2/ATP-dependent DNA helicase PcrA
VLLNKNYRSSKRIVDAASFFIGHNQKRFKKNLESVNEVGSEIQVLEFNTKDEEYEYILSLIKTLKRKCSFKDIALIFRTNNLARNLTTIFSINEIPFKFKEKPRNILEHYAVKDILAYLEYAYGEKTRAGLFKIINKPVRYIKREYFENKDSTLEDALKVPGLPDYAKRNIKKLVYDLNFIKDYSMFAAINFIRKKIGYEEYAVKNITGGQEKVNELIEAIDLLAEISRKAHGYKGLLELLDKYQEDMDKAAASTDEDADAVTFITMHGSKGLEYKHVILPEVNEGNVPSKKATTFEAIEEERRVFYVAMTRAKENLFITYLKKGNDNRFPKSRFLSELS